MKVTVCFGNVRVVVPCGEGNILVKDLIRESTLRYKKATGKCTDTWVTVHNLQSQSGGGILDPDDRLNDVVDDRETIIANFEDGNGVHHGDGDGASGSSIGTNSPDIFHEHDKYNSYPRNDIIEVTGEQIASGLSVPLQVRRGSEPALNQLPGCGPPPYNIPLNPLQPITQDPSKRWSAAPIVQDNNLPDLSRKIYLSTDWPQEENDMDNSPYQTISRDDSNRLSMQFLGDGTGYKWSEAAERTSNNTTYSNPRHRNSQGSKSLPRDHRRKEPLGQANSSNASNDEAYDKNKTELVVIKNEPGQLGLHVVSDYDVNGKERGLLVQGIEAGGRIDRNGKLNIFDRIIEINDQPLASVPFQKVQEIFKKAQTGPELILKVQKHTGQQKISSLLYSQLRNKFKAMEDKDPVTMIELEEKTSTNTKVATVSPTKKVPQSSRNPKSLLTANTRKIGKKIELELVKGMHGLGFSITTRDNPTGGNCPIYIKNILPKGAAVEDGRLKPGDRLLEVNGIEMTGKTQSEAVAVLRNAPSGSKVHIVVSRQEEASADPGLPKVAEATEPQRKSPIPIAPTTLNGNAVARDRTPEKTSSVAKIISQFQTAANNLMESKTAEEKSIIPPKHREILTFNIPVHETEKAGLGVSVKGKTTPNYDGSGSTDLGIFVKSVLHGGAASRDKRLRTNDQLLNVNGISLLHQSNSEAMETLRQAMLHTEGPVPGSITVTVARRSAAPHTNISGESISSLLTSLSGTNSSGETDNSFSPEISQSSEKSRNTIIYLPSSKHEISNNSISITSPSNSLYNSPSTWNPVIDRITGNSDNNATSQLRNESYYLATHEQTWSDVYQKNQKLTSPTINQPSNESVLIENEYILNYPILPDNYDRLPKPPTEAYKKSQQNVYPEKIKVQPPPTDQTDSNQSNVAATDVTYASQLSLENPASFSRDALGRQSISEKRHATLDAKSTGTYQKNKKHKEKMEENKELRRSFGKSSVGSIIRVGSADSIVSLTRNQSNESEETDKLGQLGPSLGMKKSSSLESLQTLIQERQIKEDRDTYRRTPSSNSIGKNGNISYGKYENKTEEGYAKKHWLVDANCDTHVIEGGFVNNQNSQAFKKGGKKKPSLFKGIGSMFRFGRHRKTMDILPGLDGHIIMAHESIDTNKNMNIPVANVPPTNITMEHGNDQQHLQQKSQPIYNQLGRHHQIPPPQYFSNPNEQTPMNTDSAKPQLKQRRHVSPMPNMTEPTNEKHIQQNPNQSADMNQGRAPVYNCYGEIQRPGSRSGISDTPHFSHYMNHDEIQYQLSHKEPLSDVQIVQMRLQVQQQRLKVEEERRQQHYHSQRQPLRDNIQRPMSNFYEYESIQSLVHNQNLLQQQQMASVDKNANSNSLTRQTVSPQKNSVNKHFVQHARPYRPPLPDYRMLESGDRTHNQRYVTQYAGYPTSNSNSRGPFVTQVKIEDQTQKSSKSGV